MFVLQSLLNLPAPIAPNIKPFEWREKRAPRISMAQAKNAPYFYKSL